MAIAEQNVITGWVAFWYVFKGATRKFNILYSIMLIDKINCPNKFLLMNNYTL